jgi:hypothetical protein
MSPSTNRSSQVNFWLLLAATLAVDALAFGWVTASQSPGGEVLFDALSFSQISVACIWWMLGASRRYWSFIVPIAVATVAMFVESSQLGAYSIVDAMALFGSHIVAVTAALWVVSRMPWYRRRSGSTDRPAWQFSVAQFLVVMTLLAVLIVVLKKSELIRDVWAVAGLVIVGNVVLATGAVFIWQLDRHALVHLAMMLAVAFVVAVPNSLLLPGFFGSYAAYFVIQTLVIWLWLEVGRIIPGGDDGDRLANSTAPA